MEGLLVRWMGPSDANGRGIVHGGQVMHLIDDAAGLAAVRHAGVRVVTASVDRLTFLNPVQVGDVLRLVSRVNATWRSSMEVGVRVEAENPRTGERTHTSSAFLTMVALADDGRTVPVPALPPGDEVAERRRADAELRRANRLAEREQLRAADETASG